MTPEMEGEEARLKVTELPRSTEPPPDMLVPAVTVREGLDRPELGILLKVLSLPEMVLLVSVWLVLVPTTVVVASGSVMVLLLDVGVQVRVPVTPPDPDPIGADCMTSWLLVPDKLRLEKVGAAVVVTF